jgi:hypothetical protein
MNPCSPPSVRHRLNTVADIRHHFERDTRPLYFISPSHFNLMGLEACLPGLRHVNLIDAFDGRHPGVTCVPQGAHPGFLSVEEVNAHLLASAEFGRLQAEAGPGGRAIFLFSDEALERSCRALGLDVLLPPHAMVREFDSKIVTTQIGLQAGVPSVPHVLAQVGGYDELRRLADAASLGPRLVVQLPYGDSGRTTFFIDSEADYQAAAEAIEAEAHVKVMRRIRCAGAAIEACATRWGTVVGPLCTELIGAQALTPYRGGWCGNELYSAAYAPALRRQVMAHTQALGDALYRRGWRGQFELDWLIDLDTQQVYLGELNPRLSGITALTNLNAFSDRHVPLILFHLLEYDAEVDLGLDLAAYNRSVLFEGASGLNSQMVLKHCGVTLQRLKAALASGVYRLGDDGRLHIVERSHDRRRARAADEGFVLRLMAEGEGAYPGADLAIVCLNHVLCETDGTLNEAGARWARALGEAFERGPVEAGPDCAAAAGPVAAPIKSGRPA